MSSLAYGWTALQFAILNLENQPVRFSVTIGGTGATDALVQLARIGENGATATALMQLVDLVQQQAWCNWSNCSNWCNSNLGAICATDAIVATHLQLTCCSFCRLGPCSMQCINTFSVITVQQTLFKIIK